MHTQTRAPTVRPFEPTARFRRLMRVGNTFMRPLLHSRWGRRIDDLALLSFTGRRSGRRYTVPVGYHELEGHGVVLTTSPWKANLRGGADVEVEHKGRRMPMRAELIEDPHAVAQVYGALLRMIELSKAKLAIGLEVIGDKIPTEEEIERAVGDRRAVVMLRPR
jgi:F420H(2)-dependent quinone reductase